MDTLNINQMDNVIPTISPPVLVDNNKQKIVSTFEVKIKNKEPSCPSIPLIGSSPPVVENILQFFTPSSATAALSPEDKRKIEQICLSDYSKSLLACEVALSRLAAKHPDSKKFSQEMCRRLYSIAKIYYEIKEEDNVNKTPLLRELNKKLLPMQVFMTFSDATGTGSVGCNPISINNVIKEGTLREQMMLIYSALWTILPKVLIDREMVEKVNSKLIDFKINVDILDKEQLEGKQMLAQSAPLAAFRKAGSRKNVSDVSVKPKLEEIENLTIREARSTTEDFISNEEFDNIKNKKSTIDGRVSRRVQWVKGKDIFKIDENCDFVRRAIALGGLPIVTGPSGTTDGFLQGCDYLNMQDYKEKAILALIGWMVPEDHSVHEIRTAGEWHDISYPKGPEMYEKIYSQDRDFQIEFIKELDDKKLKPPNYYFSEEHQDKIARELNLL